VLSVVNFLLCFLVVGFFIWPLTWIAFMIFCLILANDTGKQSSGRWARAPEAARCEFNPS